ncbi:13180_t:CDS:1 [Funneliformis mosseae]|uniref:13180_t:CDS:1 n=1 Tax=Funneliformis mosseae TaxID=27381 RepID=A0A9N9CJW1_FUNMO|nr:13180_t:CDS:1 [Funneliformis mosseae]
MASKLNDDCLYYIFQYLEGDCISLLACLLVDRKWCRSAVPILWSNPWKYRKFSKRCYSGAISIINTYISTLPEETKQGLIHEIIVRPNLMTRIATFEYEKYMRSLNVFELEFYVRQWVNYQPVRFDFTATRRKIRRNKNISRTATAHQPDIDRDTRILMSELLYLFLVNSQKIETLYISDFDKNFSFILKIAEEVPEAKKCLQKLRHLKISTHQPITSSLTRLSEISRNVEHLEIENCNVNSFELKRLINVQNSLKELTLEFVVNQPYQIHNANNVLSELSSKAKFITRIEIRDAADLFVILNSFENLIELIINNTDKCNLQKWEHLSKVRSLKKLKKLFINNKKGPVYFKIIADLINRSSCNLDMIVILTTKPQDPTHIGTLIESISKNCSNLRVFKGLIGKDHTSEFSLLLQRCNQLKILHIYPVKTSWGNEICRFDGLLQQMTKYLSFNLNRLFLENGWLISEIDLFKHFVEGRKLLDLQKISFYAYQSITYRYQELVDICENYRENDYLLDYHFYLK